MKLVLHIWFFLVFFSLYSVGLCKETNEVHTLPTLNTLSVDFNGDGLKDRAILMLSQKSPDYSTMLLVEFGTRNGFFKVICKKDEIAWHSDLKGTWPVLRINKDGLLVIHSENYALGREKWEKELFIKVESGGCKIIRYKYRSFDDLSLKSFECYLDYGSDLVILNGRAFLEKLKPVDLNLYDDESLPELCQ